MSAFFLFFLFPIAVFASPQDSLLMELQTTDVKTLHDPEDQRSFLEKVFHLDQTVRRRYEATLTEYGHESREIERMIGQWRIVDSALFEYMVDYVKFHDYPDSSLGEIACIAPIIVVHHVRNTEEKIEIKRALFPKVLDGYRNGAIGRGMMLFYLYRWYQDIFGEEYQSQSDQESQIDGLIAKLNLFTR